VIPSQKAIPAQVRNR